MAVSAVQAPQERVKVAGRYFQQDRSASLEQVQEWARQTGLPWEFEAAHMDAWNFYWGTHAGRKFVRQSLQRTRMKKMILDELKARDLPEELLAVAVVESGLANIPASKRSGNAGGVWMFMPGTARAQGLLVGPNRDERQSVE